MTPVREKPRATPSETHTAMTSRLAFIGAGLRRPECILTHASGYLFASDWAGSGGIALIAGDGSVHRLTAKNQREPLRPNGIALEAGGSFLLAHLGAETGGVFRLLPDGTIEPVLLAVAGRALPPSNFPLLDDEDRLWLSVSTTITPRAADYRAHAASGFIVVKDRRGARVAVDGLGYANEMAISADGRHLYVNETFARRLTRFTITAAGDLTERHTVATFGPGTFPDGVAVDGVGGFWVTSIVSNRVIHVDAAGHQRLLLADADTAHVETVERAFQSNLMDRPHLDQNPSRVLRNISSLAFGGPDLRTAYLGCLLGEAIAYFPVEVAGLRPRHFDADIAPLLSALEAP